MISFIIPVRNEEKAIEKTLQSIRALTIEHEIIVSDGGSIDRTIELATPLADNVVRFPNDRKQTISGNRNNGAQHAQGDFLVFVDSDCVIPGDDTDIDTFFAKALEHFDNNPKLVGLTAWVKTEQELETFPDKVILGFFNYLYVFMNNVLGIGAAVGKFQMMKRSAYINLNGYNEQLVTGEDHDMFQRLAKVGETRVDPSLIVCHSNRRAHALGWPKLLWIWTKDTVSITFKRRSTAEDWTDVR
jgi:glycosyltransferase involved in cell wall biosynthesis